MKFTVLWTTTAEQQLAAIWLNARDRLAIVEAVAKVDAALAVNPLDCGESREEDFRVTFEAPLGFDFKIFAQDRCVKVVAIWRTSRW